MPARTLGDAIRDARLTARLLQQDLAPLTGASQRTLSRWESGGTAPSRDARASLVAAIARYDEAAARRLAGELGVPIAAPVAAPQAATVSRAVPKVDAAAAIDTAVMHAADALDLAPRRVRTAFAQMLLQLAASGLTLEESARALSVRRASPPAK